MTRMGFLRRLRPALLVLCVVACSRGREGVVLDFWAMGREGEVVQLMVPEFERRLPTVRVRVQQVPWSAAHEKLLTAHVGGALPDVIQVGNTWLPELVTLAAVEPLDSRIAASSVVHAADYFAGVVDATTVDGATYAVPWYVDTRVLFYRVEELRAAGYPEPPATWQGWLDALTRVKARAGRDRYAILLPMAEWEAPVILGWQHGARLLRDNDRYGDFRAAPFREAFTFYLDLFRRGLAPLAGEAQVANLYQDFAAGYFSVFVSGPWNVGELDRRLPAVMNDRWATAPMPGGDDGVPGVSLAGGASLAVVRGSARADAAWRWIEYLSEPAQQKEFHMLTGDLPARTAAWEDAALRRDARVAAFRAQLEHLRATPKIPEWERVASKIGTWAEEAIRGRVGVDEALVALDRDVDTILEKRRWLLDRGRVAAPATTRKAAGG